MNAENEEETGMKCGRCCPDCPIENDEDKSRKDIRNVNNFL
jgi:hypothetical protein